MSSSATCDDGSWRTHTLDIWTETFDKFWANSAVLMVYSKQNATFSLFWVTLYDNVMN